MRIILDTDKKTVTVPHNFKDKVAEINRIAKEYGGEGAKQLSWSDFLNEAWTSAMANTDKNLIVAQKPAAKK